MLKPTIDFGYQQIPVAEKEQRVAQVFSSVANQYDLMNDLMSAGIHRFWKRFAVSLSGVRPGHQVLDVAGGTGDLAYLFSKMMAARGKIFLTDINSSMLQIGRDRMIDRGIIKNIIYLQANAENLPFHNNYFDCITLAFGLRNMTHKLTALQSMYRVLKPGGQLLILEFSKPLLAVLRLVYDTYSFRVLPKLGEIVTGDVDSYQYLAESIRMHPDQETLKNLILSAGFDHCEYHNLTGGIVALHRCWKY